MSRPPHLTAAPPRARTRLSSASDVPRLCGSVLPWIFVNRAVYKVLLRFLCSRDLRAIERWAAKICIGRDWR